MVNIKFYLATDHAGAGFEMNHRQYCLKNIYYFLFYLKILIH